jgi:uncharacterized protein YjiK
MRRDFYLPAALTAALAVMGVYAAAGPKNNGDELAAEPVRCEIGRSLSVLSHLNEASGLATSRRNSQLLWSHNDSGDATIYALGLDGKVRGRLQLTGASADNWEAITTAPCADGSCLYVGDIGDNGASRSSITIYRTPEPLASDAATVAVTAFHGVYPDGPQDAEAIFIADGSLYVVSKGEKAPIRIYRFPTLQAGTALKLERVATLTDESVRKADRITDAALSPDRKWVALRTNARILFLKTAALISGNPGTPLAFDLGGLNEPRGEGIAWHDGNTIYLAGEAEGGGTFGQVSCNLPG